MSGTASARVALVTASARSVAVSGDVNETIKIGDLTSARELRTLPNQGLLRMVVAVTPDGKTVVSGSSDKTIKVWMLAR
jgi:WD40 repeat protein